MLWLSSILVIWGAYDWSHKSNEFISRAEWQTKGNICAADISKGYKEQRQEEILLCVKNPAAKGQKSERSPKFSFLRTFNARKRMPSYSQICMDLSPGLTPPCTGRPAITECLWKAGLSFSFALWHFLASTRDHCTWQNTNLEKSMCNLPRSQN